MVPLIGNGEMSRGLIQGNLSPDLISRYGNPEPSLVNGLFGNQEGAETRR